MYPAIIEAAGVALSVTILFAMLGARGPWGSVWSLFLVLFLAMLATVLYMGPLGPMNLIKTWAPLILPGILFALLLIALTPQEEGKQIKVSKVKYMVRNLKGLSHSNPRIIASKAIGRFFWLVIMIFTLAVIVGLGV